MRTMNDHVSSKLTSQSDDNYRSVFGNTPLLIVTVSETNYIIMGDWLATGVITGADADGGG